MRILDRNDVDLIYAMSCENKIYYQYHPPFVTKESILEDMKALPLIRAMIINIILFFWRRFFECKYGFDFRLSYR